MVMRRGKNFPLVEEEEGTAKKVSFILDKRRPSEADAVEKAVVTTPIAYDTAASDDDARIYDEDGYWSSPSLRTLKQMNSSELRSVANFTVGRKHYGQITFKEPVDLTSFANLDDIAGNLITFMSKLCLVYPDETLKPKRGEGLNLPATITLEGCYPVNKKDKLPILDPKSEVVKQHIDKLKQIEGLEFRLYDPPTGTWVFDVESMS